MTGGIDEHTQEETRRTNEEMALAAVEFLRCIIAMTPQCRHYGVFDPFR